jgi:alkyl sulfatase BDS1-like metallo-beta-lactamase superfamily hydrolase
VRNSFLAGAYELRSGVPSGASPKTTGPDLIRAMGTDLWLDYLGVRLDSEKAEGAHFVVNLVTPDDGGRYAIELSNGVLTNIQGFLAPDPDLVITMNRSDLETVWMGQATLEQQIENGKAMLTGDAGILGRLRGMLSQFSIAWEILPGTIPASAGGTAPEPFEQVPPARTDGG